MRRAETACRDVLENLLADGMTQLTPPSVLPARMVLELSGEAIRSRLCAFTDNSGAEFAMRPDMTTPIAKMLVDGEIGPGRYACHDLVFRLPTSGRRDPIEFEQVGFEWFGEDDPSSDAQAFAHAASMVSSAGLENASIMIGDVGLFRAVVDALSFTPLWADRLKRSFARSNGPIAVLDAAGGSREAVAGSLRLGQALSRMADDDAESAVEQMINQGAVNVMAGRSVSEVTKRLIDRAESALPDVQSADALKAYLSIQCDADDAVTHVTDWSKKTGVDLGDALVRTRKRHEAIAKGSPDAWARTRFAAVTGKRFEYYDGFAFEFLTDIDEATPVLAGGRYDGLVGRIDPGKAISAIGCAMRADRLPQKESSR